MPKLPFFRSTQGPLPGQVSAAWRFWSHFQSLNITAIAEEAEHPFHLALIGTDDQTALLAARLALEMPAARDLGSQGPVNIRSYIGVYATASNAPAGSLLLDADPLTAEETHLAEALAKIVMAQAGLRLSLARHIPAFRPAVTAQLIGDISRENARIALISALPAVLPFTAFLSPATALGDMIILTRNQMTLLLKIAAVYGKEIDLKARTRELLPVIGSAFGWRAAARELVGLVPGGIGLVVKGSVAYAGTYTIGKAAAIYYSTGQTLTGPRLRQLYRDSLKDAVSRIRPLLKRAAPGSAPKSPLDKSTPPEV